RKRRRICPNYRDHWRGAWSDPGDEEPGKHRRGGTRYCRRVCGDSVRGWISEYFPAAGCGEGEESSARRPPDTRTSVVRSSGHSGRAESESAAEQAELLFGAFGPGNASREGLQASSAGRLRNAYEQPAKATERIAFKP